MPDKHELTDAGRKLAAILAEYDAAHAAGLVTDDEVIASMDRRWSEPPCSRCNHRPSSDAARSRGGMCGCSCHEPCIHAGVFASGNPTERCGTCGRDVPYTEL